MTPVTAAGTDPRTDGLSHSLRQRGRSQTASYWQLLFRRDRLRDNPASSARFSWVRRRCRNRSSPCRTAPVEAGSASRCRTLWSFQSRANPRAARPYRLQHTPEHCHSSAIVHAPVTHGEAVARSVPTWELPRPTPASRPGAHSAAPAAAPRGSRMIGRVDPFIGTEVTDLPAPRASPPRGGGRSRRWATRIRARRIRSGWCPRAPTRGPTPRATGGTTSAPRGCRRRSTTMPWHPDSRTSSNRAPARSAILQLLPRDADARAARRPRPQLGPRRRGGGTGVLPRDARLRHPRRAHRGAEERRASLHVPAPPQRAHRDRLLARRLGDPARRDDPAAGAPRVDRAGNRPGRDRRRGCAPRGLHRVRRQALAADALVRPTAHARRHPARIRAHPPHDPAAVRPDVGRPQRAGSEHRGAHRLLAAGGRAGA